MIVISEGQCEVKDIVVGSVLGHSEENTDATLEDVFLDMDKMIPMLVELIKSNYDIGGRRIAAARVLEGLQIDDEENSLVEKLLLEYKDTD